MTTDELLVQFARLNQQLEQLNIKVQNLANWLAWLEVTHKPIQPQHWPQELPITQGCKVCGIGSRGEPLGYVCPRTDCPTRVSCYNPQDGFL